MLREVGRKRKKYKKRRKYLGKSGEIDGKRIIEINMYGSRERLIKRRKENKVMGRGEREGERNW